MSTPSPKLVPSATADTKNVKDLQRQNEMALRLQQYQRARRAYQDIKVGYGFNIKVASKENTKRIFTEIRLGSKYLVQCIAKESKEQKMSAEELKLYQDNKLTLAERALFNFIYKNINFRHATPARKEMGDSMSPLKVRQFEGAGTENRHTSAVTRDDGNLFFTAGIGKHPTPGFLGNKVDTIVVNPSEVHRKLISDAWMSGHIHEYKNSRYKKPIRLGDTEFLIKHDGKTLSKNFRYIRSNGLIFERRVHFKDEVFSGRHLLPAIALQFIQHLRFVGGIFQKYIFDTLASEQIANAAKLEIISAAMTELMPGWITLEVKIPAKINLNQAGISTEYNKVVLEKEEAAEKLLQAREWMEKNMKALMSTASPSVEITGDKKNEQEALQQILKGVQHHPDRKIAALFKKTIENGDLAKIQLFIDLKVSLPLYCSHDNEKSILTEVFEIEDLGNRHAMLKLLLNQGIRFTQFHGFSNPLYSAIKEKDHISMAMLLKVREIHPNNPHISYGIDLNMTSTWVIFKLPSDYLTVTCKNKDEKAFEMLVEAGADPHLLRESLIQVSVLNKNYAMLRYLNKKFGQSLAEEYHSIRSPLITFSSNNDLEGIRISLELGADPNCSAWLDDTLPNKNKDKTRGAMSSAGFQPIHFAVTNANIPAIELLCKTKANLNAETECFETPLMLARRLKVGKPLEDLLIRLGAFDTLAADTKHQTEHRTTGSAAASTATATATVVVADSKARDEQLQNKYIGMKELYLCTEHEHRVVAIVTGYNAKKERVVLMGRYWQVRQQQTQSSPILAQYDFPIGARESRDKTWVQVAVRQLKIDTGLDLHLALSEGSLKATELPPFVYSSGSKLTKIVHLHFEIGEVEKFLCKAGASFAVIDWLPLETIQRNPSLNYSQCYSVNYRRNQCKIKGSYGMILELLGLNAAARRSELTKALPKICAIENFGAHLLVCATLENNQTWMEDIIQHGVSPLDVQAKGGMSLFGLSLQYANPQIIQYVGKFFFDEKTRKPKHPLGTNPLMVAIYSDREDRKAVLELLFTQYNFKDEDPEKYIAESALYAACSVGDEFSAQRILKEFKITDLNKRFAEQYFITESAQNGFLDIVRLLVGAGASVNPGPVGMGRGYIVRLPLHAAIKAGKAEVVKFLLAAGADVNLSNGLKKEDKVAYTMFSGERMSTSDNPFDMIESMLDKMIEMASIAPMSAYALAYFYGQQEIASDILQHPKLDLEKALIEVQHIQSEMKYLIMSNLDIKKSEPILVQLKKKIAEETAKKPAMPYSPKLLIPVADAKIRADVSATPASDIKQSTEKYSIFLSTAHRNAVDEQSGTGDVDYTEALVEAINANVKPLTAANVSVVKQAHYIRKLITETEVYQYINLHKAIQTPVLHIMINAPKTGFAFTVKGLTRFKQTGGKLIVTAVEFFKHSDRYDATKLQNDTLLYLSVADAVIFLDEFDKDCAIQVAKLHFSNDKNLIEKLAAAKVIPVPPTITASIQNTKDLARGSDIITFGMIRAGKGLAHVQKLANLMKQSTNPIVKTKKVLIVGTVQEQDPGAQKQFAKLMTSLYPLKKSEIAACHTSLELKTLLTKYKTEAAVGKLAADLPMELHVDVPKSDLPTLFKRCAYAYLPMYRGATLRNSSISNAIAQLLVTYSHQDMITPKIFLEGKYQKAMVVMGNDQYEHYANRVLNDIEKREADKKLNEETIQAARQLMEDVLSRSVVAQQHVDFYGHLGILLKNNEETAVAVKYGPKRFDK